jgi:hypothetical protein
MGMQENTKVMLGHTMVKWANKLVMKMGCWFEFVQMVLLVLFHLHNP